jgi:hypothetical protein
VSDISETLRKQKGRHKVAKQEDGDRQSRGVLYAHSRSTPLTISEASAKNAAVRITKRRSDIFVALQSSGGLNGDHDGILGARGCCVDTLTGS